MTKDQKKAFNEMLAALKRATDRADKSLPGFRGRTPACQRDYEKCKRAIALAEAALSATDGG